MLIKEEVMQSIVINKSKFIAYLFPCDLEKFKLRYQQIKKEHYNATHHCFAYILKDSSKYYDDKEPGGSAGLPIYTALKANNLVDVGCVVVRYFGGIKLGRGGLYRAYLEASNQAIMHCRKYVRVKLLRYMYCVDYKLANKLKPLLLKIDPEVSEKYDDKVTFIFASASPPNLSAILTLTRGLKPLELAPIWLDAEKKI